MDLLDSVYDNLPSDPTWIGIGFIVADIGALLVLIALILGESACAASEGRR